MNVPWLTRENVASHLQKYRLYLSRLQKDNDLQASYGGIKQPPDATSREPSGNTGFQNSINIKQNNATNSSFGIPGDIVIQNTNPRSHEGVVSLPVLEPKGALVSDAHETQKATSSTGVGLQCSFGTPELDTMYKTFFPFVPPHFPWNREPKPQLKLNNGFNLMSLPNLHDQIQVNNQPTVLSNYPKPFNKESDKVTHSKFTPFSGTKCSSQNIRQQIPGANAFGWNPFQSESPTENFNPSKPITSSTWSSKNQPGDHILVNEQEFLNGSLILRKSSALPYLNENFPTCLLQEDCSPTYLELQNNEFSDCNNPELIKEPQLYLYDSLKFDYEYPCDPVEYHVMDQGLFIA